MARAESSYGEDPILRYRPPFAQSLPVQILLAGVALTLAAILLLHLLFTAQYHWPLARTNYALQIAGVFTLLTSIVATIYVIFSNAVQESQHWPYMLSYLSVEMPAAIYSGHSLSDPTLPYRHVWTPAERSAWVVMNATTSVIVQITHIHFLTLLFPSHLEARLIFGLLGPLAVISAVMQLLPVLAGTRVAGIAEDTRNVCNASLSVLFTAFLLIWGFLVNRRQAWRTDGGTAAFGIGAITLAFISTTLNFLYVPKQDQYPWMPKLMWAITLWQSFLGWWWWVGAGMGVREVEELMLRESKRQQKRFLRAQRRKEQREKARSVWKGVTGAFRPARGQGQGQGQDASRSRSPSRDASSSVDSAATSPWLQPFQRWLARLRHAHLAAAHIQATERAERIQQVYQREGEQSRRRVVGWGLGSFRIRETEREMREEMELEEMPQEQDGDESEWKDEPVEHDVVADAQLRYRGTDPTRNASSTSSVWWWGPLRQWRLKDSTSYR